LFSRAEIRDIIGRASTIDERRAGICVVEEPEDETTREQVRDRLMAWRQLAAAGDSSLFARRLAAEGLDERSARALLGKARLADGEPLPRWARSFAWVAAMMTAPDGPASDRRGAEAEPVPFEELLRPVVRAACRRLSRRCGDRLHRLGSGARSTLQRSLLLRLSALLGRGLFGDFVLFRHLSRDATQPFWSSDSRRLYDLYLAGWREGRGRDFFLANPVAARLIGTAVAHWLDGAAELIERFDRDHRALAETFFDGAALGAASSLEADLSDPHHSGRTVAILGFGNGRKLVYKPKDLRVDQAWFGLLHWLGARGAPVALRAARVLVREGYGWSAFVRADEAERGGDPVLFHRRAGGLLALFHAMRGIDFHYENVIAAADFPIPVDLETLLHPERPDPQADYPADPAAALAITQAIGSVLGTLYLPLWIRRPEGGVIPIGGLDAPRSRRERRTVFSDVNTDAMAFATEVTPAAAEAPGRAALAAHVEAFIGGFADLYRFLVHHRDALAAADGPLAAFRGLPVRVLLGSTIGYVLIQRRAAAYPHLGDGADWSIQLDFRSRLYLSSEASPERWRLLAAERRAMARLDVPLFTANTDADWLESCDRERIDGCLADSPFDQVLTRLATLGDDDRRFGERLVRSAVGSPVVRSPAWASVATAGSQADFVAAAVRLGEVIEASAVRIDGRACWIGVIPVDHDHGAVAPLGPDLYSGTTGVALFLAALWRISGIAGYRDLALEALGVARDIPDARDGGAQMTRLIGIGGGNGIGSLVYGLVRVAELIEEPSLLSDASRIARLVDAEQIAADRDHDVLHGAAGAVLGLLALYRASGDEAALAAARACGEHLLHAQIIDRDGNKGWRTLREATGFLAGFSHGAAGIALALLRLYRATRDDAFRSAAVDALSCERRMFLPEIGNWPDLRSSTGERTAELPCGWCHGAAGIGLARVGCLELIDDGEFIGEIEAALVTTRDARLSPLDHLCCGNLGRTDFLLTAGLRLGRPELTGLARDRAATVLARSEARSGFTWLSGDDSINPSLFQGIAGIAYQLLRLAKPAALPSVLLWDC
jgi:type 2 lantibiotic biosynthesis protein LanM